MKRVDPLAEDDRARATAICGAQGWSAQLAAWLTAYDAYEARRGHPKRLKKATILPSIETDLYGLYDAPEGKLISDAIREISTGSCPMCGSANTGTVDHFLPRRDYPEFSIFTPNLVPACPACNMFTKRLRFQGPLPHEHLLHPHYDRLLDHPIWLVTFHGNTNAITFKAVPVARLAAGTASRVQFHLDTVLGREFRKTMRALWRNHPDGVAQKARDRGYKRVTRRFFLEETTSLLGYAAVGKNQNSWTAAFYRGVLANPMIAEHLRKRTGEVLRDGITN